MALMEAGIKAAAGRLPKMITPKAHAAIDYLIAGSFLVAGTFLWQRHRRAAIASIACGVAGTVAAMITDYPGGVRPMISLATHEKLDGGLASMVGAMPLALRFSDDREATFFRAQALAIAVVAGLTAFEDTFASWQDVA
jgi:hypothetical protein